jgi:isopenicillin N synthase-like dioxygenase
MSDAPRAASPAEIPVLDISKFATDGDALAQVMRQACESTGFFYVRGHGVPQTTIDNTLDAMRRFFALPLEQRMRAKLDRYRRGYMPLKTDQFSGYEPDLKESYTLGLDLPLSDPDVVAGKPLAGPNLWLPEHDWFRAAAEAYFVENLSLGYRLLALFARSLGLPDAYFSTLCKKPIARTRMLHYPEQAIAKTDKQVGAGPHTDFAMFTILHQDPVGGLEIRKRDGEWISAPNVDGAFVINVGDLMMRWTNDLYTSTWHRVIARTGKERYSIATFFSPDFDAPVACFETCRSAGKSEQYEPISAGEYLMGRYQESQKVDLPVM